MTASYRLKFQPSPIIGVGRVCTAVNIESLLTLACAARVIVVGLCVCPSIRLSTVYLGNHGNSERETWIYYKVGGMHGKLRFWSEEGQGSWCNGRLPR